VIRTATACCVVAGLGLVGAPATAAGSARAAAKKEIFKAITENTGIRKIVGDDLASVTGRVRDPRTNKVIGRNVGFCVTAPSGEQLCNSTVFLPHGQLVLVGVYSASSRVRIPITGGTDRYAGAGGYADIRPRGPLGSSVTFVIYRRD
jgi:hypothetical protein